MSKEILAFLKLLHGSYNTIVLFLFINQGALGFRIRRGRRSGSPRIDLIGLHRKAGPVLAILGISGFLFGALLVYLDKGQLLQYPLHFMNGLAISALIVAAFLASRRIRGENGMRKRHAILGVAILVLYVFQVLLGLGILL